MASTLVFSFFFLPVFAQTGLPHKSEEQISSPDAGLYNSQNVSLLSSKFKPQPKGSTGGPDEIRVENDALVANVSPITDVRGAELASSSKQISVYVVRPGDTLSEIAEMFGVKVSTIRGFNNIRKDSDLKPGMELLILPIDGLVHKVVKGDTLSNVAKKYKSDENDIALFNDIGSDGVLEVGSEIVIPNGEIPETPATKVTKKTPSIKSSGSSSGYNSYPSGFYAHPIPRGSVKSQGFHGPYQAQDLAAATGTPVAASSAGTVIAVRFGWSGGYGNMIIVNDGLANVLYAHLSEISVTQGQTVSQGDIIGKVGSTGRSTGPHLHIEYRGNKGPMKTPIW